MKVFVYRKSYLSLLQKCKIYFYKILRYELLFWGEDRYKFCSTKSMIYPISSECSSIQKKARNILHYFFDNNPRFCNIDIYTLDYFRKKYDIEITDYYAFEKSISNYGSDKCIIIGPRFYESIILKKKLN